MPRSNIIKVPQCVFQTNRLTLPANFYKLEAFEINVMLGAKPSKEDRLYALRCQYERKIRN